MKLTKFLQSLFEEPPSPVKIYHHGLLGAMQYIEDDEAWSGVSNGVQVSVAYGGGSEPDSWLIEYAISLVENRAWLEAAVVEASNKYLTKHPSYTDEVRGLAIDSIHIYDNEGIRSAFIELKGGRDYRAWRMDFAERKCYGLGFDS